MLSSPSTSGKTYEDPCPIQTRRDKRIESESLVWAGHGLLVFGYFATTNLYILLTAAVKRLVLR
jgi:hypothetical protein